jgi:hypothetical protein
LDQKRTLTASISWSVPDYSTKKTGAQSKITASEQTNPKRLKHLYASKASDERAVAREWGLLKTNNDE